jgi:hypothetical protein
LFLKGITIMKVMKNLLAAGALAAAGLFATEASAVVFSPFNAAGSPGLTTVSSVTGGYTASYWVSDDEPESPANSSPSTIETFSESITGLALTSADNSTCTGSGREGLGGSAGQNKKCIGNVFTVKLNDDAYMIFVYASALSLNAFQISIFDSIRGKLSHMDVYNSAPSPVPVPPAALLLASGVLGIGALARKKRKA